MSILFLFAYFTVVAIVPIALAVFVSFEIAEAISEWSSRRKNR